MLDEHICPVVASLVRELLQQAQLESVHNFRAGRFLNCEDGVIPREASREQWVLVTFDVNTIPDVLRGMAEAQEDHAGVIFISSKSFAQNDHGGLARALAAACRDGADADRTNRILFLSKAKK